MENTNVEIGMLLDEDVEFYQSMLENQGGEIAFSCETHDLYYTNKTRSELEKMTEKQIKDSCVILREVWAFGGSEFNGDFAESYLAKNYNLFNENKKDSFSFNCQELKKYIAELEEKDWLLFFDTFKRCYEYKMPKTNSKIKLEEIDNVGLVVYYSNSDNNNMEEELQRKALIDELNAFGFSFDYKEQGIDKLRTLLSGRPHFSNNQNK